MVSFQQRLLQGLAEQGFQGSFDLREKSIETVLVIGGTHRLDELAILRRRGVRIVQRLDGMNWLHRLLRTGWRHFLRAEYGNWLLNLIRTRLADHIIYQSEFSHRWWETARGRAPCPNTQVHNAVDLARFRPHDEDERPADCYRLLMVEGRLMGGYEMGMEVGLSLAAGLAEGLAGARSLLPARPVELSVAGQVGEAAQARFQERARAALGEQLYSLRFLGTVEQVDLPALYRSAHLFYSADLNPACPNAVIEALACGTPVLAYATGALPELVDEGSGRVIPYGADPWRLEPPDLPALVQGGLEILQDQETMRRGARLRAEEFFGLDRMVQKYLEELFAGKQAGRG
jgi:glycosyltransferase involved in cell wall biosynthesis